jgi:DNA-binding MarR family transcriptional regulator
MDLEDNLFFLCTQVVYRRTRLVHEALKEIELLPTEFRVLSATFRKGPLTMLELAQWTAFERTRLTHILHGMEDKGWVERTSAEHDRRTVLVAITAAGRQMFRKAKSIIDPLTDRITDRNSEEELGLVREALRTMRGRLLELDPTADLPADASVGKPRKRAGAGG